MKYNSCCVTVPARTGCVGLWKMAGAQPYTSGNLPNSQKCQNVMRFNYRKIKR